MSARSGWPVLLVALMVVAVHAAGGPESVQLFRDGEARCAIVLPAAPHADEALAAGELVEHLLEMSGVEIRVAEAERAPGGMVLIDEGLALAPGTLISIRVGLSLTPGAEERIRAVSDDPAAFLLEVDEAGVTAAGLTPEGTLLAAYELLERLGVRWYMPGDLGTVVPQRRDVSLEHGSWVVAPSFAHRHLQAVPREDPWYRRQRLGGDYFPSSHGIPLEPPADFETEPELFALIDGERVERQLCIGNPEVLRRAIAAVTAYFEANPEAPWIGLGPDDGRGFCDDDRCRALDGDQWDPFAAELSMTDRYVWFFNQVLAGIEDRFPDKRIAFYAYAAYKLPPVRWEADPRIVPALAPITLCRIHGMNNPVCPERSFYRELMTGWGQAVPEVFERGYYFNLADPALPWSKVHAIREETPIAHALGVAGWRVECMPSWVVHTPTLYVAARLMWDVEADVDALLAEFHEGFFGPAAKPMGAYLTAIDHAFRDADCHTGGSHCARQLFRQLRGKGFGRQHLDAPLLSRNALKELHAEAALAAGDQEPYAERVRLFRQGFERLVLYLQMLDARDALRFDDAHAALQKLYELTDEMAAFELAPGVPLHGRNARRYLERFWAPAVDEGYRATVTEGELVGQVLKAWDFVIDPDGVGERLGYYRPEVTGGNWQPLLANEASWGDVGLHYYKGKAWYRTGASLPSSSEGRRLHLQFGGVDEQARVWLNGTYLGQSDTKAFQPFDLDATEAARPGLNTIAVEITNEALNELGSGGITAPVFFWMEKEQ